MCNSTPIANQKVKKSIKKLYNKNYNLFYRLFIDEFSVQPSVLSQDLYKDLGIDKLFRANLLWKEELGKNILCHGIGHFFPINMKDKVIFMLTDWPNPYIKRIGDIAHLKDISSSKLVFPTFKFKEQFYYHIARAIPEIENLMQKQEKVSILDFGTGAGAYLLYLASYFKDKNKKVEFYGTEINPRALEFCEFNIKLNDLEDYITISNIDILRVNETKIKENFNRRNFDVILANPPYVPTPKEVEKGYPIWGKAGKDGLVISSLVMKKSEKLLSESGKLLMVSYSLGNKEAPLDIFKKIEEVSPKDLTFFISHIYPPVWVGFNPLWKTENPIPVERLALRFRIHPTEDDKKEDMSEAIGYWLEGLHREGRNYLHHLFIEGRKLEEKAGRRHFFFHRLSSTNLSEMIECERESWPSSLRASPEKLVKRLETYPEGVWGTFVTDGSDYQLKLVGFGTSQIVEYFPSKEGKSWREMTMDGDVSRTHNPGGNTIHLVSGSVIPKMRGYGIWRNLIILRILQAYFKNLEYAILHSRIPYYQEGQCVEEYAPTDPYIKFLLGLGFKIRDIIENCEDDPESGNYCILMSREVKCGL